MEISYDFNKEIYDEIGAVWFATGVGNPARGDSFEVVENTLRHDGRIITVREEDKVIATCWLTSDFRRLYVHHMAVLPAYQNQNIGHQLMKEAVAYAKTLGLQMKLEVNENNPQAIHLYKKYGFEFIEHYLPMIKRNIEETPCGR